MAGAVAVSATISVQLAKRIKGFLKLNLLYFVQGAVATINCSTHGQVVLIILRHNKLPIFVFFIATGVVSCMKRLLKENVAASVEANLCEKGEKCVV